MDGGRARAQRTPRRRLGAKGGAWPRWVVFGREGLCGQEGGGKW